MGWMRKRRFSVYLGCRKVKQQSKQRSRAVFYDPLESILTIVASRRQTRAPTERNCLRYIYILGFLHLAFLPPVLKAALEAK